MTVLEIQENTITKMKNEITIGEIRKAGNFIFYSKIPKSGNRQKDKADLKLAFEKHLSRYFDGDDQPAISRHNGPENY